MHKAIFSSCLFALFFILFTGFIKPQKLFAESKEFYIPYFITCDRSLCGDSPQFQGDCTFADLTCRLQGKFCPRVTGSECCQNIAPLGSSNVTCADIGYGQASSVCQVNPDWQSIPSGIRCSWTPAPTPTPCPGCIPTPTPEPCITYGTTGDLSYPNTCSGTNGFYTDKCSGNQTITYSCSSSGACQSFTSTCSPGETCVEEPANGLTHCVLVPTPAPGVVVQEEQCNSSGTAWVAVTNVCVVSSVCGVPPVPTPTPTPVPCQVTTSPSSHSLVVGGAGGTIAAYVSSGQGTAIIKQMRFGSYNTAIATVNRTSDSVPDLSSRYNTTAACGTAGNTAVWATADLSDGRICQSTGTTDTDIICVAPIPTPTPVPGTVTIQGRNVDTNGAALTTNIGQSISISGPTTGTKNSLGAWDFTGIPTGTYTVTAVIPAGYTVSYSAGINQNSPNSGYIGSNSLTVNLSANSNYADIWFKYTPVPCLVTTSPKTYNLTTQGAGKKGDITAIVTGVPAGKTVSQMLFGSYNTTVATVKPASDSTALPDYSTTVTAAAAGKAEVWATAELKDAAGNLDTSTCQSTAENTNPTNYTDTVVNVSASGLSGNIGDSCPNGNSDCKLNYCDPITKTCQNPPAGPGGGGSPPLSYSISGKMFNDANENGKSNGDSNYTGAVAISLSPAIGSYTSPVGTGNYSFANLPAGQYTITFSGLPADYRFTYPTTPGNALIVSVGPSCSFPGTSEAACSSENIIDLNAGVTNNLSARIQSIGSDMRLDSGLKYLSFSSPATYASLPGTGGMPGVIYSGCSTPNFGLGQASQTFNWQVGGAGDKCEVFTTTHNLIPTSYQFFSETAQSSGITPTAINSLDGLTHGIYKVEGDLNLSGSTYTFGPGNFIILVNGNLNINQKIKVPLGSTAIFSVKGNITVNRAIGESSQSSAVSDLEGLYSADNNFVADGANSCPIVDLRLNIAGSVIANAGRSGGTFVNNRTLCAGNAANPSVSFTERPDFMLSYPSMVSQNTRSWKNEAP